MPPATPDPTITRGHKKKARTRRQLVAAAVDVIGERGEAFTVSDVTARAGVSNGTFYNYFDDRDALIGAVVPEVLGAFAAESAITVAEEDPAVRFATITALALAQAAISPDAIRVVLRLDAVQQAVAAGEIVGHLRHDLRLGVDIGRFAVSDEDAALDVIVGSLLLAARRIVDGAAGPGADDATVGQRAGSSYGARVIEQLLRSLGINADEAAAIADQSVLAAMSITSGQTVDPPSASNNTEGS